MPVDFSIKNVPDDLAEELRRRARQNHRSLQGELMAILEQVVQGEAPMTISMIREKVKSWGLQTGDEAVRLIREDRDGR
jgi:plasmid stability protein